MWDDYFLYLFHFVKKINKGQTLFLGRLHLKEKGDLDDTQCAHNANSFCMDYYY